MTRHGRLAIVFLSFFLLPGCISSIWTGANLIYDRHNIYKKITDYQLTGTSIQALYSDEKFKRRDCTIDVTVFKENILLAGHVPTEDLREEAQRRVAAANNRKRIYNQLEVTRLQGNTLTDSWITTKIRTQILADASIDPNNIKITTTDSIVYLLGEMQPDQAKKVIHIARNVSGVRKVVKILQYYTYTGETAS